MKRHTIKGGLIASFAAGLIILQALSLPAAMAESSYAGANRVSSFSIAAQSLPDALLEYGEQSNLFFAIGSEDLSGIKSQPVSGTLRNEDALKTLLAGAGYTYQFVSDNEVRIVPLGESKSEKTGHSKEVYSPSEIINEIIVTAQKRKQSLKDVPMSISALGDGDIEAKGIDGLVDLSFMVPGVMIREEGPGRQVMFMRGIGNNNGAGSLTSTYLDEAPVNLSQGGSALGTNQIFSLQTTDIERVEVLHGPQGTLYGSGAASGTVRFITKDPELDSVSTKGDLELSFTKNGDPSQKVMAVVNMPVVEDKFAFRIASTVDSLGGWIDQPGASSKNINNQELVNVRVKALLRPTESLDVKAMAIVHRNKSDVATSISDEDGIFTAGVDRSRQIPLDDKARLYNLIVDYDIGFAQLLSSSTYIDAAQDSLYTYRGTRKTLFFGYENISDTNQLDKVLTQEFRLTSNDAQSLLWTVGAFYRDSETKNSSAADYTYLGAYFSAFNRGRFSSESWAVFADTSYGLTQRFEIGGGIRYFEDDRELNNFVTGEKYTGAFDAVTWRSYLSYDVTDRVKAYANIGTGFRSGGFNVAEGAPPYEPENILSYEVGAKMILLDGRMNLDIALFYTEYQDMLQRALKLVNKAFTGVTLNIGEAEVKGIDINLVSHVTDNFIIDFNSSISDGEITQADLNNPTGSIPGDPIDYAPDYTYSIGAEYRFNWQSNIPGFFRLDFNGRGKSTFIDRSITPEVDESDKVDFLNARLGAERGKWTIQVFAENILDEYGSLSPTTAWSQTFRPRPRTIGIKAGVNF